MSDNTSASALSRTGTEERGTTQATNFMDENLALTEPMEIIFCRNVIIYFDRTTQEALITKFWIA